jgi:hypothetical protein
MESEPELERGTQNGAKRPESDAILKLSIEEGLRNLLGESGLRMVLSLYPLDGPSIDPVGFHDVLKGIFMEEGAAILEQEIARRLLEKVGRKGGGGTRSRLSWMMPASSDANGSRTVSEKDKEVLRQFVASASFPKSYRMEAELDGIRSGKRSSTIEQTSLRFASAFKKGS